MSYNIRKLAFLAVGSIILLVAVNSYAEQKPTRADIASAKLTARFAADDMKAAIKAQEEIVALKPEELRNLAIMLAAGLLSSKLNDWGLQEIADGKKTQNQMMYISGLSLLGLSRLTQAANLNDASACHYKEAMIVIGMSQGKPRQAANCRQAAYGTEMQVDGMKEMYRPEMKQIQELVNKWATNVALYSSSAAKLDGYGTR